MARNRPTVRAATTFTAPQVPFFDMGTTIKLTTDLMAQVSRLWVDLWFSNLNRASAAFWNDVSKRGRAT
jgi:hypothetical protein